MTNLDLDSKIVLSFCVLIILINLLFISFVFVYLCCCIDANDVKVKDKTILVTDTHDLAKNLIYKKKQTII